MIIKKKKNAKARIISDGICQLVDIEENVQNPTQE